MKAFMAAVVLFRPWMWPGIWIPGVTALLGGRAVARVGGAAGGAGGTGRGRAM